MVQYDVEAFMAACERKGLAAKTLGSYEQTLRLFGQFLSVREIERTEEVKRVHIENYILCKENITHDRSGLCLRWEAMATHLRHMDTVNRPSKQGK